jgi:hypothetical protein
MKQLIPYILSYLIITEGISVYTHFFNRTEANLLPPNSVTVITTLSHDQLAAKLQQAGLQEAKLRTMTLTFKPAPLVGTVFHFLIFAVYFGAFVGLTLLFQRMLRADIPDSGHAA